MEPGMCLQESVSLQITQLILTVFLSPWTLQMEMELMHCHFEMTLPCDSQCWRRACIRDLILSHPYQGDSDIVLLHQSISGDSARAVWDASPCSNNDLG
jgi:hypothetical protein